jgi:CHAD domain-containing protein
MRQAWRAQANGGGNGQERPGRRALLLALPPGTLAVLAGSLRKQWKRYRKGLKACQERFSEAAVHQSRVETRRLLSVVELLEPLLSPGRVKKIQTALKHHLDSFDDLRDTQVQLSAVRKLRRKFAAAAPFHKHLRKREERFTRATRKRVKCIRTKRLEELMKACREEAKGWCAVGLSEEANELLRRRLEAAFRHTRQLQERIDPRQTDTIHRTRIAFKKFRYMIELLAEHLPLADRNLRDRMHDYQTMMGDIQDAEILLRAWDKFQQKNPVAPGAARRFRAECLRRRRRLIAAYLRSADRLESFWPGARPERRWRAGSLAGADGAGARPTLGLGTAGAKKSDAFS